MKQYDWHEKIYEGSLSIVYRGVDRVAKRPVIGKILKADYPTPEQLSRYHQEYQITRSLNLSGVVQAYALERYQNSLMIILEDFGGESLEQLLQRRSLSLSEFLAIALQVTQTLAQIHAAHIIHKDLNPSNLIYNSTTGQVKIIDFGLSSGLTSEVTSPQISPSFVGTLAYISPEQTGRMNCLLDYRTDFYSLGVTFYELLTGELPFKTQDSLELIHCHIAKQPPPPNHCPEVLAQLILKLLEKNPESRYQSATGIYEDLKCCWEQLRTQQKIKPFPLGRFDYSDFFKISQKLYGRSQEIDFLLHYFERHLQGVQTSLNSTPSEKPALPFLLVSGAPGIGKSALVKELYKPITEKRGVFLYGKFEQYKRDRPYSTIIDAFQSLIKAILTENEQIITQYRKKILEHIGKNSSILIEIIPELELILGTQSPAPILSPNESKNRFNLVLQDFISIFAKPEHPLVLCLDDLQWADLETLDLIRLLVTRPLPQALFIIGTYRDNEISPLHPLSLMREEIDHLGYSLPEITLQPLDFLSIGQLVADTLNLSIFEVMPLAELLGQKTNGNPFFLVQFLKTLYDQKYIVFDHKARCWIWDLVQLQSLQITDNVVELLATRIQQLHPITQEFLQQAACIGNCFEADLLAVLSKQSALNIQNALQEALEMGLIFPVGEQSYYTMRIGNQQDLELSSYTLLGCQYKFIHDYIQQAAYSLVPEEQKPIIHQKIGEYLLHNTPEVERDDKLFDIVNQLNLGLCQLPSDTVAEEKKIELAQLNWEAGIKAKQSTAYAIAFEYLQTGVSLLPENSWQNHYDFTLQLFISTAEVAYLSSHSTELDQLINKILPHTATLLDQVKVHEIKIQSLIAQGNLSVALNIGLKTLSLLGLNLPPRPSKNLVQEKIKQTQQNLINISVKNILELPPMVNLEVEAMMGLLANICAASYLHRPSLFPFTVCTMVDLSLQYGNSMISPFAYAAYGLILCGILGDIDAGYELADVALDLAHKIKADSVLARTMFAVNNEIKSWKLHFREVLNPLKHCYQIGVENGDLEFAGYAAMYYCSYLYWVGTPLSKMKTVLMEYIKALQKIQQPTGVHYLEILLQLVYKLTDQSADPTHLLGKVYTPSKFSWLNGAKIRTVLLFFYLHQVYLAYIFGDYDLALEQLKFAQEYSDALPGCPQVAIVDFYSALVLLEQYHKITDSEQESLLQQVYQHQASLKKYVDFAPMNHWHKYQLIEGKIHCIKGEYFQAIRCYEEAIQEAKNNRFIQDEAMAYELITQCYKAQNNTIVARAYIHEAHYHYRSWGAVAKVKQIEQKYNELLIGLKHPSNNLSSSQENNEDSTLDINSVLKASQALGSEIIFEQLLTKMMKIVIENAGADRGVLLLGYNDQPWQVVAAETIGKEVSDFLQSPLESLPSNALPKSMIYYVMRTQENLVLADVMEGKFSQDPYIIQYQPQSVLCMPLLNQGQLIGILYLENKLIAGAFTEYRLKILRILAAQAAIALEKSLLYQDLEQAKQQVEDYSKTLEQKVKERTKALQISESRYRAIVEDQTDLICRFKKDGTLLFVNDAYCRYFGVERSQILSQSFVPIIHPEDREKVQDIIEALSSENPVISVEQRTLSPEHPDDPETVRWQQWINRVIINEQGEVVEYQGVGRDVTLQKKAAFELEKAKEVADAANRAKSEFLANMSHELRTPLNAILGFSQLLQRETEGLDHPKVHEYIQIVNRSGEHLRDLINDILDMSKIEAGRLTLNQTDCDLSGLLRMLEDLFQLKAQQKGLALCMDCDPAIPPLIVVDQRKLRQVLINLLGNGIKFTVEGEVRLGVMLEGASSADNLRLRFEVRDTGVGIGEEDLPMLFEPFVQTEVGRQSNSGTGLGLAISQQFVELMGGKITVQSRVGEGTVFEFTIPVLLAEGSLPVVSPVGQRIIGLEPDQPNYRILVVDDRWSNRHLLVQLLEPFFEVQEAKNGEEAIALFQSWHPHLIWMDVQMPGMNGYETTRYIKSTPEGQNTPIIALTASIFDEEQAVIVSVGCDDWVRKPFASRVIFEKIQQYLGVRYRYGEEVLNPAVTMLKEVPLTRQDLAALPLPLQQKLHEAALTLKYHVMIEAIAQVPPESTKLRDALRQLADNFRYDTIIDLTEPCLES
ncbi:AAA family ATPase [Spirulina subsalsa FACHB-351]|uniref:histidine kinase n=1 Tax=Spirulina subsalsa FACHB-351 TaxID=234711 RepID=A0ABT3L0T5_9CYAN|nr:AAA family ATPase [Spirulina subsalsa]MCW6035101.1 AAA family ATPase [Spirulina subsalsa FACHB-351]